MAWEDSYSDNECLYDLVLRGGPLDGHRLSFSNSIAYPLPVVMVFAVEIEGSDDHPVAIDMHRYCENLAAMEDEVYFYDHGGITERIT